MAVIRSSYGKTTVITPFLVRVRKDVNTSEIVIEDIIPSFASSQRVSINRDEVWVEVMADYTVTVLNAAPTGTTTAGQHVNLAQCLVKIKGGEVFVTEHSSTNATDANQDAVTGYSFGTFDRVYLKLDRTNNSITVYQDIDAG